MEGDGSDDGPPARESGEHRAPEPSHPTVPLTDPVAASPIPLLGERPVADDLARAVARTRIGNQLFATDQRVRLGRYHLLEIVGAGGMGVVWGGWDPELERRVAIKLVKATLQSSRNRILVEGQALAKLSHPNVVAVYDVGVVDEQVYLVMEWVRGQNLRAYFNEPHPVREIVAVYRAAGEGLLASHAAGLIHRDFKPDNAIIGDDGRVRVLDFGLARGELEPTTSTTEASVTRGAGTPRYMSPEQAEGGPLTPSVDQFAFCVSLREALQGRTNEGDADVPGWLDAIIARGTAPVATDRFPSMAELLRALARDPAMVWRRRLVVGGVLGAAVGAFVVGNLRAGADVEPCVGGTAEIARTWNPQVHARLVARLSTLGPYGQEAAHTLPSDFDTYSRRWADEHRNRCLAFERHELTEPLYERNLACLSRARAGFETTIAVLFGSPSERLANAVVAARGVPDPELCVAQTLTSNITPPPPAMAVAANELASSIERVRALARADDPTALDAAKATQDRAAALGYRPLLARAELATGLVLMVHENEIEAIPWLARATVDALDASDDAAFVEAYTRELHAVSINDKDEVPAQARDLAGAIPFAEHVAIRLGAAGVVERALLFSNIGGARMAAGDPIGARAWFDRSLVESAPLRENNVELVFTLGYRALVSDAPDRERLFGEEHRTLSRLLGANHRDTLVSRRVSAMFVTDPKAAADSLRETCERLRRFHPSAHATIDDCTFELGWLAEERGDLVEARAMMSTVKSERVELAQSYVVALDGHVDAAAVQAHAFAGSLHGSWWNDWVAANALLVAAQWFASVGKHGEAVTDAERALAILEHTPAPPHAAYLERRLARAQALVARLVTATDRRRAHTLAAAAEGWYRAAHGYESLALDLERLVASTAGR